MTLGLTVLLWEGCHSGGPDADTFKRVETRAASALPTDPSVRDDWRKDRFITVSEAVDRLQPHVDERVALPDPRLAYLPRIDKWMADPKYLSWDRDFGARHGTMRLVHKKELLILTYGLVTFDGCGGTDFAISTEVDGQPALLKIATGNEWSQIAWPMQPLESSGNYGLTGTLEGWQAVKLAGSMKATYRESSSS